MGPAFSFCTGHHKWSSTNCSVDKVERTTIPTMPPRLFWGAWDLPQTNFLQLEGWGLALGNTFLKEQILGTCKRNCLRNIWLGWDISTTHFPLLSTGSDLYPTSQLFNKRSLWQVGTLETFFCRSFIAKRYPENVEFTSPITPEPTCRGRAE